MLAIAAGYAFACPAQPDIQPQAQVSSHALPNRMRMVFDWNAKKKVPFTVNTHGNQVVLHFERPISLDWGDSFKTLRPYVQEIETQKNGTTVILTLNGLSEVRYFTTADKSGIDLVGKSIRMPVAIMANTKKPVLKTASHVAATHPKESRAMRKDMDVAKLAALSPAAGETEAAQPAPESSLQTAQPSVATKEIIALPVKDDEPLAVFIRQKNLWIVSNNPKALAPDTLITTGAHFTKDAQKVPSSSASIVYMPLNGNTLSANVEKSPSDGWRVIVQNESVKPSETLALSLAATKEKQSSITIATGKAEQIVSFHDPIIGDTLSVVPLLTPGAGVGVPRSFVEFNLLQSAQGIAVQKIADDIALTMDKGMLSITTPKGLAISPETAMQIQKPDADTPAELQAANTLFPYARWRLSDDKNFVPADIKLVNDITFSTMDAANKARLKLLGLYLAEGLFAEAHGMAEDILRSSFKFYAANKVAALRGAALFFMNRLNEAERDFASPELANVPEAIMWRDLCKELLGEGADNFNFLANYDHLIHYYPPVFIQKLAVIAADRSINHKDYDTAMAIFDILKKDSLEEPVKKYTDYMRAKILSETKNEEEAAKIWEKQAADIDDPLIRARAEFSLVNMLLRQDRLSIPEAIKRLEKLRIVWRGDNLELNTLTLLGNLYIEEKQYSKALHTFRDIVLYYPDTPEAITTAQQMESTFVALYNKGGADNMLPIEALSLFYEFRDLVPIGKDGDLMIRNLADRLVNIDLLDRAALLLDHQIRKRLQSDERSRVGARLALIYLLNHRAKDALETLKTTGYGDLPADLQLTRLHLTAQALAQEGQTDKAIDVLSNDNSAEGTALRLQVYWDNKDWPNVVTAAEEILGNRNDPSAALLPQESDVLLKLATAYVYEHDTGQIQYLRDYFTPLLKNNPNKDSFLFITSESGTIDYGNLANLDQDITAVKSFLDNYRDKVKKDGLSKAIN